MSLIEVLIASFVLVLVLTTASSAYLVGQRAWQKSAELNEITQNSRIALDKLSRELRQTDEIITDLPTDNIEFQDGHSDELQYLHYYLDNNALKRQIIVYELGEIAVKWNVPGAERKIKQVQVIAEKINNLRLSGNRLVQIEINDFATKVIGRNMK